MKRNEGIPGLRIYVFKKAGKYEILLVYYGRRYKLTVNEKNLKLTKPESTATPEGAVQQSLSSLNNIPGLTVSEPLRTVVGYQLNLRYTTTCIFSILYRLLFIINRQNVRFYKLAEVRGPEPELSFA